MNKIIGIVVVLAIIIGGVWMLRNKAPVVENPTENTVPTGTTGGDEVSSTPAETTNTSTTGTAGTGATGTTKTVSFTVTGENFSFSPSTMKVKKGDTVKITLINNGGFHDLKIDGFNVATKKIDTGEQDTITFVADKTGSFEYYCTVGTHRAMGMKGTLVVE